MTEYRVVKISGRTVVEHGIRDGVRLQASKNAQRLYAIHRADAVISLGCYNIERARHHAAATRQLVVQFASVQPFSAESGRRYIEATR